MPDQSWNQTACILCYVNCGLEVATEGRKITRVRGDRANPARRATSARRRSASSGTATTPTA